MRMQPINPQQAAALSIMLVVSEAIRGLGSVPGGTLYAQLMNKMTLQSYESIIGTLKGAGLVSESASLLKWIGPEVAA